MTRTTLLTTRDGQLLTRAKELATKAGRRDWRNWLQERAELATRGYLGLSADVSPKEAARIIGIHLNSFWNYEARGMFPSLYYTSPRRAMVPLSEVLAVKERTVRIKETPVAVAA